MNNYLFAHHLLKKLIHATNILVIVPAQSQLLQILQTLLVYPCLMIRNPHNFEGTSLGRYVGCKKDVLYHFINNVGINWRRFIYQINLQLRKKMTVRSDHHDTTTYPVIDDTDFPE